MKYTTIDRIYNKLNRDLLLENINEADVVEWMGEALEAIGSVRSLEEAVAFLQVENFQTQLPYNLHNIIQIARNNMIDSYTDAEVSDDDETLGEPETDYPVCIDCNGMPYNAYTVAYYRPYFDLQYEYNLWGGSRSYKRCYSPVRLATSSFFHSLVCSQDGRDCEFTYADGQESNGLYDAKGDEYTIVQDTVLRFNFQTGLVAVSYLRNVLDDNGIPKIPDTYSNITAITKYITFKLMERNFYLGKQGYEGRVRKAESDWQWYCKQASNEGLMLTGIDEHENFMNQHNYLIPRRNVYDNFFGNLGNREVKTLLGANERNHKSRYGTR